jgi:hypothetical protein
MLSMIGLFVLLLAFVMILPTTPAADEAGYVRLRMVEIPDEQGFGQPVVALRLLAPTDWRIEGRRALEPALAMPGRARVGRSGRAVTPGRPERAGVGACARPAVAPKR